MRSGPVLLYDGSCGFCSSSVQFVLRHERLHTLRFAPLQGEFGGAVRVRHPEIEGMDSVVWLEPAHEGHPERVLVRSTAALRVVGYLGGAWRLLLVGHLVPSFLRDWAYDFVARHRHQIPLGADHCDLPTAAERERFIQDGTNA